MRDLLVRLFGWRVMMLHGDPCVTDRWMFVRENLTPGSLATFDAGAGNGAFTLFAASRGNRALGLSFDDRELEAARRRAKITGIPDASFRPGDLRDLSSFASELGTFDHVICLEVIEHVIADSELVAGLARLLRPGGRLILTTPAADHRPLLGEKLSGAEDGGHVRWGYEAGRLRSIVESSGLEVVSEGRVSGLISQKLTNAMRWGQHLHPILGWAIVLPLRPLRIFDALATRITRWPYLSVSVVAVRRS
jgi:SAM-dependent methyltransferase